MDFILTLFFKGGKLMLKIQKLNGLLVKLDGGVGIKMLWVVFEF